jgi:aryl-alcohol dehydrogenase-like predicted oxidoreductase
MKRRRLGDSDLEVSEISLGSWLTYSGGVEREHAEACTKAAYEAGINFFDTANAYGQGASEEAWGEILSSYPRDSYVLATKVFFPMSGSDKGLSATQIAKQIDASLTRLKTNYVDLYQCHRFDPNVPIEETMEALSEVVKSGKARYIGFSEWTPEQIRAGLEVDGAVKFVSSQPQYSMLWRGPEQEVFNLCRDNGISQIVWSPLAQGVLTGKYKPGGQPPAGSRAASSDMNGFMNELMTNETLEAVQNLKPIAEDLNCSMSQLALAWVLGRSEVASAITGASRPEQVIENVKASELSLSADVLEQIDRALNPAVVYESRVANGANSAIMHRS